MANIEQDNIDERYVTFRIARRDLRILFILGSSLILASVPVGVVNLITNAIFRFPFQELALGGEIILFFPLWFSFYHWVKRHTPKWLVGEPTIAPSLY